MLQIEEVDIIFSAEEARARAREQHTARGRMRG